MCQAPPRSPQEVENWIYRRRTPWPLPLPLLLTAPGSLQRWPLLVLFAADREERRGSGDGGSTAAELPAARSLRRRSLPPTTDGEERRRWSKGGEEVEEVEEVERMRMRRDEREREDLIFKSEFDLVGWWQAYLLRGPPT